MAGRHSFETLRAGLPADARATATGLADAMGGELEIIARFPNQPHVRLRDIGELTGRDRTPDAA